MEGMNRLLLVAVAWWLRQGGAPTVAEGCQRACGGVSVPFPFGLEPGCARSEKFLLSCKSTRGSRDQLMSGNFPIRNISTADSTMVASVSVVYDCYDTNNLPSNGSDLLVVDLSSLPQYRFSDTQNSLIVLGCDTYGYIYDEDGMFRSGCVVYCDGFTNFTEETTCGGIGCCQAYVPKGLRKLELRIFSIKGHAQFNSCGVAFVGDRRSFNVSNRTLPGFQDFGRRADLILDWMVGGNVTCRLAKNQSSYACGGNAFCHDVENGRGWGYRCLCKDGYDGNPYDLILGCQDVDECKDPQKHPCPGYMSKCKNQPGHYACECPFGTLGDANVGCHVNWGPIVAVAAIILALFVMTVGAFVFHTWRRRSKEKNFRRNGGELLKRHRVQIFTEAELAKATNNYDDGNKLGEGGFGSVYRGRIAGDTVVAVKKPKDMHKSLMKGGFQHELEIVMQINHKNVVKLHGICLETRIPLLVYEYISNGTLFQHIHQNASTILRSWKSRLRIAAEAALALEYMHSCAEPPIIHGDIKSVNILLDHNYSVKVSDFGTSVFISPELSHVVANEIQGTLGYIDPEYLTTGMLTVKSDVYSFGVVLVELLTGKKPTSFITHSGESINIVHHFISSVKDKMLSDVISFKAASEDEMERVGMVAEIAVKCLDQSSARRPAMREVAEQLAWIDRELRSSTIEENNEQTETEVDEENLHSHAASTASKMSQQGTSGSLF